MRKEKKCEGTARVPEVCKRSRCKGEERGEGAVWEWRLEGRGVSAERCVNLWVDLKG